MSIEPIMTGTYNHLSENERFYDCGDGGYSPGYASSSLMTSGPNIVKQSIGVYAGCLYILIGPITLEMYTHLSENEQCYDRSDGGYSPGSTSSSSTTSRKHFVKQNAGADEGRPYTSIEPATSETYTHLSENGQFYECEDGSTHWGRDRHPRRRAGQIPSNKLWERIWNVILHQLSQQH